MNRQSKLLASGVASPLAIGLALLAGGAAETAQARSSAQRLRDVVFIGSCDSSGAVPLSSRLFAVADDEDNVLRVYDADRGGSPVRSDDLSASLFEEEEGRKKKKRVESDIEAATRLGDTAYWLTSHGRNREGKRKDERMLFFATTTGREGDELRLVGRGYERLLEDLIADSRYAGFALAAAAELAPKQPGGLSLEGLGERPEGGVWIGFRNPIPGGLALLAPLLNPERVVEGETAQLGDPARLDLGGLGVRSLSHWRGRTLIVAGSFADGKVSRLYTWDGRGAPIDVSGSALSDLNPEGFFSPEDRDEILLLSDDGGSEIGGKACKRLDDPGRKRFRGRWVSLAP